MISNKDWYDRVFRDERAWTRKLKPYFNNEPNQLLKVIEDSVNLDSIAPKVQESFNTEALEPIFTDLYLSQGVKYYNLLQNAVQKELKRKLGKEQIQAILWLFWLGHHLPCHCVHLSCFAMQFPLFQLLQV